MVIILRNIERYCTFIPETASLISKYWLLSRLRTAFNTNNGSAPHFQLQHTKSNSLQWKSRDHKTFFYEVVENRFVKIWSSIYIMKLAKRQTHLSLFNYSPLIGFNNVFLITGTRWKFANKNVIFDCVYKIL